MVDNISVGDKVKVGDRVGDVIDVNDFGESTQYKIAFSEGSPQKFFSPPTELQKISGPLEKLNNMNFDEGYRFDLLTRATQLSLAFEYDQLLSLSNSRINMEPYQVKAVSEVINSFKQRYLIADDVGLGKTIEAGMIIKELKARNLAQRIMIVPPASLADQWQREMREKFDLDFWNYDSNKIKDVKNNISNHSNPWNYDDKMITSIDYIKQQHVRQRIRNADDFDLIIFDEAHKLSKTRQKETQRYKIGDILADKTESMLLLTATPHNGNDYRFYHLIRLIDKYKFQDHNSLEPDKLKDIMIRRGKDRIKDVEGKPVFKGREVNVLPLRYTEKEKELYNKVTDYVKNEYNIAKKEKKRAVGFAMVILQKRMVSSIHAIKESLKRRARKLREAILEREKLTIKEEEMYEDYLEDPESLTDNRREELEQKLEGITNAKNSEERKQEIKKLEKLVELSKQVKTDSKANKLKEFVDGILEEEPDEKILIFTEYKDTLNYLKNEVLKEYTDQGMITEIHGDVPKEERKNREDLFRDEKNIMLATDAAGEGINLQFCHIMVNYELPWNPNRIDQRIGRLHRYGQDKEVKVHNLLIENTREGQIFLRLQKKLGTIEARLGESFSDILGQISNDKNLKDLIMDSLSEGESVESTKKDLERAIEEREEMIDTAQDFLMDLRHFDIEKALEVVEKSEKITFSSEDIENFVRTFFKHHGGRIENTRYKNQYRLYPPSEIQEDKKVPKKIERATFDKEIAKKYDPSECKFIAFGHPLLDNIIEYSKARDSHFGGAATVKKHENMNGLLFNYKVNYMDASGEKIVEKLIPVLTNQNNVKRLNKEELNQIIDSENCTDSKDLDKEMKWYLKNSEYLKNESEELAKEISNKELEQVKERRTKNIDIKMQEAEKYFKPKIKDKQQKIDEYRERKEEGEDMRIAIRSRKKEKQDLIKEFENRKEYLKSKKQIYVEAPKLLNTAIIKKTNKKIK